MNISIESKINKWENPERCIWQLVSGYPDLIARHVSMTMLQAYIDDSGKENDSYSMVLAGYMATAEKWSVFSNEWQSILDNAGIDTFHMVDAFRMSKEYKKLGTIRRNQLIFDLIACINRYVERAFVFSMDLEAHSHWFARKEAPEIIAFRPYRIGFHSIFTKICRYAYLNKFDSDLQIFFEDQGGESKDKIFQSMEILRNAADSYGHENMNMPSPNFVPKSVLPTQAADLLAWLCRRENHNYRSGKNFSEAFESIWLDGALSMPCDYVRFGNDELKKMSQDVCRALDLLDKG
jgi:hypothetical protein